MNWTKILNDLTERVTLKEIAEHCGCAASTLCELRQGSIGEPRHALGVRLLALHKRRGMKSVIPKVKPTTIQQ